MTQTRAKNPDYTESAVSLTNSPELKDMLVARQQKIEDVKILEAALEETEAFKVFRLAGGGLVELDGEIKKAVDRLGGYQDIEQGLYALQQRRLSVTYVPSLVRAKLPKFADALIDEVVNKKTMEGLLKGRNVTQEQANACSEYTETMAYVIKT